MALVTNLGQIHHLFGDHTKGDRCINLLLLKMMYLIDSGKGGGTTNISSATINDDILGGFFRLIQPIISRHNPALAA